MFSFYRADINNIYSILFTLTQSEILMRDRVPLIPSCLVGPPIAAAMWGLAGGQRRKQKMRSNKDRIKTSTEKEGN
jgi:hypothetical protein